MHSIEMNANVCEQLKPYVFKRSRPSEAYMENRWPAAVHGKPEADYSSKRQGTYGPRGFDGAYYLQLADHKQGSKA